MIENHKLNSSEIIKGGNNVTIGSDNNRFKTTSPRWRSSPDECLYRFDVINFQHPSGDGRYRGY